MSTVIESFRSNFIKDENIKRLCKVFKTRKNYYLYDVGTGKVFQISKNIHSIISEFIKRGIYSNLDNLQLSDEEIDQALNELIYAVDNENILKAPLLESFVIPNVTNILKSERKQLILETTEQCNMRCKYCYYHENSGGYRTFGNRYMTIDIAKKAIDEFLTNTECEEVSISFYGGEPLLNFKLIKECIIYVIENYPNKDVLFAITTNATLINEDMANFFAKVPKIQITISLDGPKEMHDKYRVFVNDEGSYDKTIEGLTLLVNSLRDRASKCIGINSVLPEFEDKDLNRIQNYFENLKILPKGINYTSSFVSEGNTEMEYSGVDSPEEKYAREESFNNRRFLDPLYSWATEDFYKNNGNDFDIKWIAKENLIKDLAIIHRRAIENEPMNKYYMNGCCIPGSRRYYVTTQGKYLICERLGASPDIGNVYTGLDVMKVKHHYIDSYNNIASKYCKNCWAIHLCTLCYMNCYEESGINIKFRHRHCMANRISLEKDLILYHEFLEANSNIISMIDSVQFT